MERNGNRQVGRFVERRGSGIAFGDQQHTAGRECPDQVMAPGNRRAAAEGFSAISGNALSAEQGAACITDRYHEISLGAPDLRLGLAGMQQQWPGGVDVDAMCADAFSLQIRMLRA
jgi:hypothetical protein